jgi:hypothetical protein
MDITIAFTETLTAVEIFDRYNDGNKVDFPHPNVAAGNEYPVDDLSSAGNNTGSIIVRSHQHGDDPLTVYPGVNYYPAQQFFAALQTIIKDEVASQNAGGSGKRP